MTFRVGQKVVCIREPIEPVEAPWREHPKNGVVYTIRGFKEPSSVWLAEIKNDIGLSGKEAGFCISRFRPIVERKTDISIFTRMLNPQDVDA